MDKKDWKIQRRTGIGGSDAAAILGFSPWKSAMDVYLEKTGLADEKPEDKNRQFLLELGTQLEPVIAKLYERETGEHLQLPFPVRWQHPKHQILFGSPDRFVEGMERGVELKSENQFMNEFGTPGTDQVPYHYLVQCAQYMAITGYPQWDIALLHGGATFSIYTLKRDEELERFMVEELTAWWQRHIVENRPPDIDGSEAWRKYLQKKYPADILPLTEADQDTLRMVDKLWLAKHAVKSWEQEQVELENRLKFAIGDHQGISGDFGKVTWRRTKDGQVIDFAAAFEALAKKYRTPQKTQDELLNRFTTVRQGSRRFLLTTKKGWEPHGVLAEANREPEGRAGLSDSAGEIQAGDQASAAEAPER